jgi:hypothetical protein
MGEAIYARRGGRTDVFGCVTPPGACLAGIGSDRPTSSHRPPGARRPRATSTSTTTATATANGAIATATASSALATAMALCNSY